MVPSRICLIGVIFLGIQPGIAWGQGQAEGLKFALSNGRRAETGSASQQREVSLESPEFALAYAEDTEAQAEGEGDEPAEAEPEGYKDESGNDPRDFRNKFMPYYRFTELRNGLQAHEWVLFGFYAFTPRFGMTYELPVKYVDASEAIPGGSPLSMLNPPGPIGGPPIPGFGGSSSAICWRSSWRFAPSNAGRSVSNSYSVTPSE